MSNGDLAAFEERRAETTRRQGLAADPRKSAWVSANAGTGKTKVLTDRVIRLLMQGVEPSKILCLTFTKTAAAEMANRLFERLGKWTTLDDEALLEELRKLDPEVEESTLDPARRLFAKALETPGGLKIQTIHAFCQSLLERFPLESGLQPGFEVLDERVALGLYREAELALYRNDRADLTEALARMAVIWDGGRFSDLLRRLLGRRDVVEDMVLRAGGNEGLPALVAARLGIDAGLTLADVLDEVRSSYEARLGDIRVAADVLSQGSKRDQTRAGKLYGALGCDIAEGAQRYWDTYFTSQGDLTKASQLMTGPTGKANPLSRAFLESELNRVEALSTRISLARTFQHTLDALVLGDAFIQAYDHQKSVHGVLDYDDLIHHTNILLNHPGVSAWVHYKLDGGLNHILVDEAQDTSPQQWAVVRALADEFFAGLDAHHAPQTIFAVGDEKQSIYSFQGAEPEKFGEMRTFFRERVTSSGKAFEDLELILSFRSTSEVLNAVDQVFDDPEARQGLSSSGEVPTHEADRYQVPGLVELWPTEVPDERIEIDPWNAPLDRTPENSPQARVARSIAAQIRHWLDKGERVYPGGPEIEPGHILILVQRRNAFVDEMVRALKGLGIPVAGRDRMVLTEQIAVMDLMALAQFALLPEDDLTLATVLRSPFIDLSEEDLFDLAHPRRPGQSLWSALQEMSSQEPYCAAFEELSAVLARVDVLRPYEFFGAALGPGAAFPTTGRERLLKRLGPEAGDPIDEFLTHALSFEQTSVPSLEIFLAEMRRDRAEIKRDFDAEPREVRIMTVHGAKGLEGRIVFLPDTCTLPSAQNEGPLVTLDRDEAPFLAYGLKKSETTEEIQFAREDLARKRLEENRRLLYVAMTRARDRLYIAGYETRKRLSDKCWYTLVRSALEPMMEETRRYDGAVVKRLWRDGAPPVSEKENEADPAGPQPSALPDWVAKPVGAEPPPRRFAPSSLQTAILGEGETQFESAVLSPLAAQAGDRFKRGLAVHRLLELLPDVSPDERSDAARRFLLAPGRDFDEPDADALIIEVMSILEHPEFAPLFGPGSLAEVPVAGMLPGTDIALNGSIDRAWFGDDEILIVDFKTNRPPPDAVEKVDPLYITQMAAYRALISALMPGKPVRAGLLWTDRTHLMMIPEAMMDARMAAIRGAG